MKTSSGNGQRSPLEGASLTLERLGASVLRYKDVFLLGTAAWSAGEAWRAASPAP